MFKPFDIVLDVSNRSMNDMFEVSSNDLNTIRLDIKVREGMNPFDLTGKIIRLAIQKPDKTVVFQSGGVTDGEEGLCEVVLSRQANVVEGRHEAELMIFEGDEAVAVTTRFFYTVKKALINDDAVKSSSDFPAINQAILAGQVLEGIDIDMVAEAGAKVQEIQDQVNQLVIQGDSSVEAAQIRVDAEGVTHVTAKERVDSDYNKVTAKIIDVDNTGRNNRGFWVPPTQPAMPWGSNGLPPTDNRDPELFINGTYEVLRAMDTTYMTRTNLGLDQSGTYPVWRYELTPKNYTRTIIVSGGTHGNEYTASIGLYRVIYHVCTDKAGPMADIRRNTRVIVHPINNPWSFKNNKRQNANGVDLNRNFDYLWSYINGASFQAGGTYYKGTAPFSEVESQYLRDSFVQFKDALAYIDFHTINTIQAEHIVFTPRYLPQHRYIFNDVIEWLYKPGNRIVNGTTAMPTVACHAASTHRMTTANPEWYNGLYGGNRDSLEMTEAVKWFGNVVLKACTIETKTSQIEESAAFAKAIKYRKGANPPITLQSTVYNNIPHATFDMIIKRHGILEVSGWVKYTLSGAAGIETVGTNPIVYQVNHPERGFADVKDLDDNEVLDVVPNGTYRAPIHALFNVFPHNYNSGTTSRPEQVKFRLRMKSSGASSVLTMEAWKVYFKYTPTDRGHAVEYYSAVGNEALAEGSDYTLQYPDPTKYGIDTVTDE